MSTNREPGRRAVATRPIRGGDAPASAGPWGIASTPTQRTASHLGALRSLHRSLPVPLVCLAADRTITFINAAASELFGYDSGELEGLPSWLLCGSGHDADLLAPQAGEPLAGSEGSRVAALALKRKDGTEFAAEVTSFWLEADLPAPVTARQTLAESSGAPTARVSALLVRDRGEPHQEAGERRSEADAPLSVRDDARRRLSQELDRGPIAEVVALVHRLHAAKRQLQHLSPAARRAVLPMFDELGLALTRLAAGLRSVARGLRHDEVAKNGLVAALTPLLDGYRGEGAPKVELRSNVGVGARFPKHVERCLYRVAQESTSNALRHARASAVRVTLMAHEDSVELLVEDDGRGFDVPMPLTALVSERRYGLAGVAQRVTSARGELEVHSAPGSGTRVWATVPLERRSQPRDQ